MKRTALASLMLTFALLSPTLAQEPRWNELANLPFRQDYPTEETARRLTDELLFERGVQSYLWALPAINMWAMKQASEASFGAGYNVLPVWKGRLSAKTLVTTPNSDVIYAMGYVDLGKEGPLVVELPPNQQGTEGHPRRFLATAGARADHRRTRVRGRRWPGWAGPR
jgi:hypothetical protein